MSTSRRSKGCRKIEMKLMTNESNRQVTFSKRRNGIFKKASELCTLTGTEIALVIFSPSQKVYAFGHPDVNSLIDRYLAEGPQHAPRTMQALFSEANCKAKLCELNAQLNDLKDEIAPGKKRIEEMKKAQEARQSEKWWEGPIDEMSIQQLKQLKFALQNLQKAITIRKTPTTLTPFPEIIGSSSSCPTLPSRMLQTSLFQNPLPLQNEADFDLNIFSDLKTDFQILLVSYIITNSLHMVVAATFDWDMVSGDIQRLTAVR
ncbi:hypothetical protein RIF29_39587 [Crotalaria pallida]|uniref:MADS-box domain-containing protein n=1 Tax=Crotalaria pallida TaxID=3830 RepID=A0AAN9E2B0_CROPI